MRCCAASSPSIAPTPSPTTPPGGVEPSVFNPRFSRATPSPRPTLSVVRFLRSRTSVSEEHNIKYITDAETRAQQGFPGIRGGHSTHFWGPFYAQPGAILRKHRGLSYANTNHNAYFWWSFYVGRKSLRGHSLRKKRHIERRRDSTSTRRMDIVRVLRLERRPLLDAAP